MIVHFSSSYLHGHEPVDDVVLEMWTDFNNLIPSAQQELVELVEHEQEREHRYPSEDEEQILYQSVVAAAKMAAISKCTEVVALFATGVRLQGRGWVEAGDMRGSNRRRQTSSEQNYDEIVEFYL